MQNQTDKRDILSKLGVEAEGEKFSIDIAQAKSFFQTLKASLEAGAQKIKEQAESGRIDIEDLGIKADKQKVEIDLEKTKNFIESIGDKIASVLEEIEKTYKEIERRKTDHK